MTLRNSSKIEFKERFTRKTVVLKSPSYRGFALWNALPEELQKIESLLIFKHGVKSICYGLYFVEAMIEWYNKNIT